MIFDDTPCELGEGPLWHPRRDQLFWFDIVGKKLLTRTEDKTLHWDFPGHVSAAGWVDEDHLIIASDTALHHWNIPEGRVIANVCPLEADNPITRSNDGRADPWGGFWIGTMGLAQQTGAGAIYRYYQGKLTTLFTAITIPNAICFAPDKSCAYFTDTPTGKILKQPLDTDGWPVGAPEVFVDLSGEDFGPDGAVTDAGGNLWNAQWGAARVACYAPDGSFLRAAPFEAAHTSCPAFGGAGLETLFCTTAREGLSTTDLEQHSGNGMTLHSTPGARGLPEHRVIL